MIAQLQVCSQGLASRDWKIKIADGNRLIASAYHSGDASKLNSVFDAAGLAMQEYQPTLSGIKDIRHYYTELFSRLQFLQYEVKTSETFQANDRIIEIGQSHLSFQKKDSSAAPTNVTGKYMQVWAIDAQGNLKLKARAEGYFRNLEQPNLFVVPIKSEEGAEKLAAHSSSLRHQLYALNTLMAEAVRRRDGNLRADFFTNDAAFMPFADTIKTGMAVLRPYLIQYNSYPVTIDSIAISNTGFEDLGTYVIEYPWFKVQGHNTEGSGRGSGKGIRLWRRNKDCCLQIFREIGLHNHPE